MLGESEVAKTRLEKAYQFAVAIEQRLLNAINDIKDSPSYKANQDPRVQECYERLSFLIDNPVILVFDVVTTLISDLPPIYVGMKLNKEMYLKSHQALSDFQKALSEHYIQMKEWSDTLYDLGSSIQELKPSSEMIVPN